MKLQNFEEKNIKIKKAFLQLRENQPENFKEKLNLSWSNWGFGIENLEISAKRLQKAGLKYIELHGNHYGENIGYEAKNTRKILDDNGLKVSGICGMFSIDNDLSSNRAIQRQAAIDYLKREIEFTKEVGGDYVLVVPGAVGRPIKYDNTEFERSIESLRTVADYFVENNIKAAIEPIRSEEVSFVHTIKDAKNYIKAVDHPGIGYINGDVFHMQAGEEHIGEAIISANELLTNLHIADSNRLALGLGTIDLDIIIMSLYLVNYNSLGKYVTAEPLGPGGDPYTAMNEKTTSTTLDEMVFQTAKYFREREEWLCNEYNLQDIFV